jgi:hypothetical protein
MQLGRCWFRHVISGSKPFPPPPAGPDGKECVALWDSTVVGDPQIVPRLNETSKRALASEADGARHGGISRSQETLFLGCGEVTVVFPPTRLAKAVETVTSPRTPCPGAVAKW